MIRNCPNCASKLVYDINMEALSCEVCGGIFDVEEFDSQYGIKEPEDDEVLDSDYERFRDDDLDRQAHKLMIDVNVFTCQSCGADVMVTNTELSTVCVYCGNSSIVFNRMRKVNKPDGIIPFEVNSSVAKTLLKNKIKKNYFVPKEFKSVKEENFIGVYVPYYVHALRYRDTFVVEYYEKDDKGGKNAPLVRRTILFSGEAVFDRLTTDACVNLNDDLSYRVEPFNLTKVTSFSDEYLYGFYADIPDQDKDLAFQTASDRAIDTVYNYALGKVPNTLEGKIVNSIPEIEKISDPLLILCPIWFYIFDYKGEKYTSVVNGQTGKVVVGIPVNKRARNIAFATTMVCTLLAYYLLSVFFFKVFDIASYFVVLLIYMTGFLWPYYYKRLKKIRSDTLFAKSSTTERFASRRQGVS